MPYGPRVGTLTGGTLAEDHRRRSPISRSASSHGLVLGLLVMSVMLACRPAPVPLTHGSASAHLLAEALVAAYRTSDRAALTRMTMTEAEFRQWVWPHLPAARPERNLPFSYVWGDLHQKSDASLQQLLARYGGRDIGVASVRFTAVSRYGEATVHREAQVLMSSPEGSGEPLRLCGSFVEVAGQWKIFSFVVDS